MSVLTIIVLLTITNVWGLLLFSYARQALGRHHEHFPSILIITWESHDIRRPKPWQLSKISAHIVGDVVLYLVSIFLHSVESGEGGLQASLQLLALLCDLRGRLLQRRKSSGRTIVNLQHGFSDQLIYALHIN